MSLADGFPGRDVVMLWNGVAIGGVREKAITLNGEPIDVTSDDDAGWRNLLSVAAQYQLDIKVSGVSKAHTLKIDWFNKNFTRAVTLTYPNGSIISGNFFLSEFAETGTYNDAVTFEATLMSDGPVTYVPGS